jgi:hypothetical protein
LGVALGVALGVGVNATGVPKDDKEDVGEGSAAAAAAPAPGNRGGGGGTSVSNTLGSVGNSPKSDNTGNRGVFIFLIGATYGEGTEVVEDVDEDIVGVKLNIVEGCDNGRGLLALLALLALDEREIGTRTDSFFTFCCDDVGEGEGNKGEKEISGEVGNEVSGLLLPLLTLDVYDFGLDK